MGCHFKFVQHVALVCPSLALPGDMLISINIHKRKNTDAN